MNAGWWQVTAFQSGGSTVVGSGVPFPRQRWYIASIVEVRYDSVTVSTNALVGDRVRVWIQTPRGELEGVLKYDIGRGFDRIRNTKRRY